MIKGSIVAIVSPMHDDGSLDFDAYRRLIDWHVAEGTNAIVAVLLTFIGHRLGLDLYLVALINFGFRIFNNVALIRRHFI